MDCTQCKAFYPTASMESAPFTRGSLDSLMKHSCADRDSNSTSDCCEYDLSSEQCGLYFGGTFHQPCAVCSSETATIPTRQLCNYCTVSFPDASMGQTIVVNNSTRIDDLVDHQCAINNGGDTSNCCLYDHELQQCGIFENDEFTRPCGMCSVPDNSLRQLDDKTIYALIGGTVGIMLIAIIWYVSKKCCYENVKSGKIIVGPPNEPTATPIQVVEENIDDNDEQEPGIIYAEIVP